MSLYKRSEKAEKWVQSVADTFVKDTGKTLDEWVEIARTCPEVKPRAQIAWFKATYGLLQNRAMFALSIAFPEIHNIGDENPEDLVDTLFAKYPIEKDIYHEVLHYCLANYKGSVASPRKAYVPLVASKTFALLLPSKDGLIVSMVLPENYPTTDKLLLSKKPFVGGERNKYHVELKDADSFTSEVKGWLLAAYEFNQ